MASITNVSVSSDLPVPAGQLATDEMAAGMLLRHQARIDFDPARGDVEVVIAAAEFATAIFDHPHASPLGAVVGSGFLEPDDAMRDRVDGAVVAVRRQVVEQDDGDLELGEIVFEGEHLTPVAQRALGQKADLGQAVDDDPVRIGLFDLVEDDPGGLAQFEIGRVEQALLLHLVQQIFGWDQFEQVDAVQRPTVRVSGLVKLVHRLGQSDIQASLARLGSLHQELQGRRRLAGAGIAFQQIDAVAREPARQDVVESFDPGRSGRREVRAVGHLMDIPGSDGLKSERWQRVGTVKVQCRFRSITTPVTGHPYKTG